MMIDDDKSCVKKTSSSIGETKRDERRATKMLGKFVFLCVCFV
jgi:hypothetical protein